MSGIKYFVLLALLAASPSFADDRTRRAADEPDCKKAFEKYTTCSKTATAGIANITDDGRKDLVERKSCNLLESLEECEKEIDEACRDASKDKIHDEMVKMIKNLKTQLPKWDSQKCPAAVHYLNGAGSLELGLAAVFAAIISLRLAN